MCVCACLSAGDNLRTSARRRQIEGNSGLSGTLSTEYKGVFPKAASLENYKKIAGTKSYTSPFQVRAASAIMVQRKRMCVRGYSMYTRVRAQPLQHSEQGRTPVRSPIE